MMFGTLFDRFKANAMGMPIADVEPPEEMEPHREYVMNQSIASPRVDRQSASVVTIESNKLLPLIFSMLVIALVLGIYASGKADRAIDEARHMERENRVMQDDLKYVRAYLSARGINVPANHEEAEESK